MWDVFQLVRSWIWGTSTPSHRRSSPSLRSYDVHTLALYVSLPSVQALVEHAHEVGDIEFLNDLAAAQADLARKNATRRFRANRPLLEGSPTSFGWKVDDSVQAGVISMGLQDALNGSLYDPDAPRIMPEPLSGDIMKDLFYEYHERNPELQTLPMSRRTNSEIIWTVDGLNWRLTLSTCDSESIISSLDDALNEYETNLLSDNHDSSGLMSRSSSLFPTFSKDPRRPSFVESASDPQMYHPSYRPVSPQLSPRLRPTTPTFLPPPSAFLVRRQSFPAPHPQPLSHKAPTSSTGHADSVEPIKRPASAQSRRRDSSASRRDSAASRERHGHLPRTSSMLSIASMALEEEPGPSDAVERARPIAVRPIAQHPTPGAGPFGGNNLSFRSYTMSPSRPPSPLLARPPSRLAQSSVLAALPASLAVELPSSSGQPSRTTSAASSPNRTKSPIVAGQTVVHARSNMLPERKRPSNPNFKSQPGPSSLRGRSAAASSARSRPPALALAPPSPPSRPAPRSASYRLENAPLQNRRGLNSLTGEISNRQRSRTVNSTFSAYTPSSYHFQHLPAGGSQPLVFAPSVPPTSFTPSRPRSRLGHFRTDSDESSIVEPLTPTSPSLPLAPASKRSMSAIENTMSSSKSSTGSNTAAATGSMRMVRENSGGSVRSMRSSTNLRHARDQQAHEGSRSRSHLDYTSSSGGDGSGSTTPGACSSAEDESIGKVHRSRSGLSKSPSKIPVGSPGKRDTVAAPKMSRNATGQSPGQSKTVRPPMHGRQRSSTISEGVIAFGSQAQAQASGLGRVGA